MENLGVRLFPRATHLLIIPLWRKPDLVGHHLTRLKFPLYVSSQFKCVPNQES